VSGDFGLTRVDDLDYSSTKTDQDKAGSGELRHGEITAKYRAWSLRLLKGSAIGSGDIVRLWERIPVNARFFRIVGKRTRSRSRGGQGQTA